MSQQERDVVIPSSAHCLTFKVRTTGGLEGCTGARDWGSSAPTTRCQWGHYKSAGPIDSRQCGPLETKLSK